MPREEMHGPHESDYVLRSQSRIELRGIRNLIDSDSLENYEFN